MIYVCTYLQYIYLFVCLEKVLSYYPNLGTVMVKIVTFVYYRFLMSTGYIYFMSTGGSNYTSYALFDIWFCVSVFSCHNTATVIWGEIQSGWNIFCDRETQYYRVAFFITLKKCESVAIESTIMVAWIVLMCISKLSYLQFIKYDLFSWYFVAKSHDLFSSFLMY